jgi:hypothetical protein
MNGRHMIYKKKPQETQAVKVSEARKQVSPVG